MAYATLGASILSHALDLTQLHKQGECGASLGASNDVDGELVHANSGADSTDARQAV